MEKLVHNILRAAGYGASGEWSSFAEAGITPLFLTVADALGVKLDKVVGDTSLGFVDDSGTRQRLDSIMMPSKGQEPGRRG